MSLDSELLAHHISTIKFGAELGASSDAYLREMKAIVRKAVAGFDSDKRTAKRLEAMIKKLANQLNAPAGEWLKELERQLKEFAKYEAAYQAETISSWVNVDLVVPTVNSVWQAAQFQPLALGSSPIDFDKLMDDWGVDEVARLTMGVKSGFTQGLSVNQIIKQVVGDGGLADVSSRNAKAVAQTTMAHVASEARFQTYKENDDIIIGYHLINTLDGKTSPICRAWVPTKVYLFTDKYQPKPAFHWKCRTTTTPALSPEFDFLDEGATRASSGADGGKQVDYRTTYYEFLKQQPAAYQDERLGKTKGLIFRNSGLSPEEFRRITVDDLGRPLTIDGMAAADKRVAEYLRKK